MEYPTQFDTLFNQWCGKSIEQCTKLFQSGSNRKYFRLSAGEYSAIVCQGEDLRENRAFLEMTKLFKSQGHPVPQLYAVDESEMIYLLEDLGDVCLFDLIQAKEPVDELIHKTLRALARLQVQGGRSMHWEWCYPQQSMDEKTIRWDLNYFKYAFLKPAGAKFDETLLQEAFDTFEKDLLSVRGGYFLYRDFQSRNVMVKDNEVYFIDYQGGRKGSVFYDAASFLFQARSGFSPDTRKAYLEVYRQALTEVLSPEELAQDWMQPEAFMRHFYQNAFFRILQVMGAYGYRGWFERKTHFVKSIPPVLSKMQYLLQQEYIQESVHPYLLSILQNVIDGFEVDEGPAFRDTAEEGLKIRICSFSYHKGIPEDYAGNGGGFVFDCRGLHNPGRYDEYRYMTGLDKQVMEFLEDRGEIQVYLEHVRAIVEPAIQTYMKRGYEHLMISFGCTGGRHRSVYAAQKTAEYLAKLYPQTQIYLNHREQGLQSQWSKGKRC